MDYEKKFNSKTYRFFEWLFMLVFVNLMTILLLIPIITILPAITAMFVTIKDSVESGPNKPIGSYFKNFMKYSEKSFLIGLILTILLGIAGLSIWYYVSRDDYSSNFLNQVGFWVMAIVILIIVFMCMHLPLLIGTFTKLRIGELLRTSMYISLRYFATTGVALVLFIISIVGIVAAPIWFLVGFSLPAYLLIKVTEPMYYRLNKIDFEKIMSRIDEEEKEENEKNHFSN